MTLLLDIINGFHKFLWYLNISPKYLNRAYTILSLFPTLYILRIVYGLWVNQNYIQFSLYLLVFVILLYFVVLISSTIFLTKMLRVMLRDYLLSIYQKMSLISKVIIKFHTI